MNIAFFKKITDKYSLSKLDMLFYGTCALLLICAIVLNIVRPLRKPESPDDMGGDVLTPWATPESTHIESELKDVSGNVKIVSINEQRINTPSICGHYILFSAGGGSLESAVLTDLYLFNADTAESERIAKSKIGEIYETYLSDEWIVWLDTDRKGKNVIYKMNRNDLDGREAKTVSVVQETENHMPKLGLYGNYLVWMEQVSDTEDKLYFVDLTTDENMALGLFEDTAYAVSAPYIYKNTVIWAEKDPDDTSKSAIYSVTFEDLGSTDSETDGDGYVEPTVFKTGTYVHKPECNEDVFVWIDKNNAPDSALYYAFRNGEGEPKRFWNNVTQYALGDGFILFVSNQTVYAYYYLTESLVQVSESGRSAIMPQCSGTVAVWEDKTDGGDDLFKYNILG